LQKGLPKIPFVKSFNIFSQIADAGKSLGNMHVGYEGVEPYRNLSIQSQTDLLKNADFTFLDRVEKMRFAGTRGREDKTTVIYNEHITIKNIPLEAYEYVVNGKPALEWVMERQCVKIDKDSGIVNDANDYAIETMNNPAYPLELFQRVITVSLETMKIVKSLPPLDLS
jgi:predicted helicase